MRKLGPGTFKGREILVLEVDPYGGFVWIETDKLLKKMSEFSPDYPPEVAKRRVIDNLRHQKPKYAKILDDFEVTVIE